MCRRPAWRLSHIEFSILKQYRPKSCTHDLVVPSGDTLALVIVKLVTGPTEALTTAARMTVETKDLANIVVERLYVIYEKFYGMSKREEERR